MGREYQRDISLIGLIDFGPSILLNDDFESGLSWSNESTGAGTIELWAASIFRGSKVLRARTANQAAADDVWAKHNLLLRPLGQIKFNISFAIVGASDDISVKFTIERYTGSILYQAVIRFNFATSEWTYLNSAGSEVVFSGISSLSQNVWHGCEIVLDLVSGKHVTVTIDDETVDLSTIPFYSTADASARATSLIIGGDKHVTGGAEQLTIFYDDSTVIKI